MFRHDSLEKAAAIRAGSSNIRLSSDLAIILDCEAYPAPI
jgi:hypothetical protein